MVSNTTTPINLPTNFKFLCHLKLPTCFSFLSVCNFGFSWIIKLYLVVVTIILRSGWIFSLESTGYARTFLCVESRGALLSRMLPNDFFFSLSVLSGSLFSFSSVVGTVWENLFFKHFGSLKKPFHGFLFLSLSG